jgi:hypothetical protein
LYIFQRIEDWLNLHYGKDHGITLALSEWSPGPNQPNLASVIYATHLGLFANHGIDFFTPWNWFTGMWETVHLFSRYAKEISVSSTSSLENMVSAYSTVNEANDSMTIIIVNREMSAARNVTVNLDNFSVADGGYKTLQLSALPASETFKSHTNNALKGSSVSVKSNSFTINVPALSTTAVILAPTPTSNKTMQSQVVEMKLFPNPVENELHISLGATMAEPTQIAVFDQQGRRVKVINTYFDGSAAIKVDLSSLKQGYYFISVNSNHYNSVKSFVVRK